MIALGIGYAISWGKTLLFTKTGRIVLGAVALGIVAWWAHSKIEQGGYDRCKGDWDASILETRKRINDAVDRARDERVPDPFDGDR